ncbi:MAG: hypothetical protein K0R71_2203, partial [Bacillales bacterium]|nr:hypothetical protein [Bacillales bacterium]
MIQASFDLNEEKQYIKGTHVITIFHNESNLYSVVKVLVHDSNIVE